VLVAVEAGTGDLDLKWPGHHPADIEEGQAAFVLLVALRGLADHARVEHNERFGVGLGLDDDGDGAGVCRGTASAVVEVSVPHTTGSSAAGKTRSTDR